MGGGAKGCCLRSFGSGIFIAQVVLKPWRRSEGKQCRNEHLLSFGAFIQMRTVCSIPVSLQPFQLDLVTRMASLNLSRPKPMPVLVRADKGLDHLGVDEVAVEAVELVKPEVVTLKVEGLFWRVVRVAMQVTKILHQHKSAVEFVAHDLL